MPLNRINIDSQHKDIPLFIHDHRTNPERMNSIILKFKREGLGNVNVQRWTQECAYEKLLPHVWAERDRKKRLDWLRVNAKWHVPLMLELAMAEMKYYTGLAEKDVASYYYTNVLPLLDVALLRVQQDIHANPQDRSLDAVSGLMKDCYSRALMKIIQTANLSTELFSNTDAHHAICIEKKRDLIEKLIAENEHTPPPVWLKGHGMKNLAQGMLHMFSPQPSPTNSQNTPLTTQEIHQARLRVAEESLRKMETIARPSC